MVKIERKGECKMERKYFDFVSMRGVCIWYMGEYLSAAILTEVTVSVDGLI